MSEVAVTIGGRSYDIQCADGAEERLARLGAYLDERAREMLTSVGSASDARILVMTGLLVADKLFDALAEIEKLRARIAQAKQSAPAKGDAGLEPLVEAVAERIEDLAAHLENA